MLKKLKKITPEDESSILPEKKAELIVAVPTIMKSLQVMHGLNTEKTVPGIQFGKRNYQTDVHLWKVWFPITNYNFGGVGVGTKEASVSNILSRPQIGWNEHSWGWDLMNKRTSHNSQHTSIHEQKYPKLGGKATGDYQEIYMVLDMDDGILSFQSENTFLGVAHYGLKGKALFPMICLYPGNARMEYQCGMSTAKLLKFYKRTHQSIVLEKEQEIARNKFSIHNSQKNGGGGVEAAPVRRSTRLAACREIELEIKSLLQGHQQLSERDIGIVRQSQGILYPTWILGQEEEEFEDTIDDQQKDDVGEYRSPKNTFDGEKHDTIDNTFDEEKHDTIDKMNTSGVSTFEFCQSFLLELVDKISFLSQDDISQEEEYVDAIDEQNDDTIDAIDEQKDDVGDNFEDWSLLNEVLNEIDDISCNSSISAISSISLSDKMNTSGVSTFKFCQSFILDLVDKISFLSQDDISQEEEYVDNIDEQNDDTIDAIDEQKDDVGDNEENRSPKNTIDKEKHDIIYEHKDNGDNEEDWLPKNEVLNEFRDKSYRFSDVLNEIWCRQSQGILYPPSQRFYNDIDILQGFYKDEIHDKSQRFSDYSSDNEEDPAISSIKEMWVMDWLRSGTSIYPDLTDGLARKEATKEYYWSLKKTIDEYKHEPIDQQKHDFEDIEEDWSPKNEVLNEIDDISQEKIKTKKNTKKKVSNLVKKMKVKILPSISFLKSINQ